MSTLSELQSDLAKYKAARDRILQVAQSMQEASGRQLDEAKLEIVNSEIRRLESRIYLLQNNSKITTTQAVFGGHRG